MNEQELTARLALNRLVNIGPELYHTLLSHFGSATEVFAAGRSQLESIPSMGPKRLAEVLGGPHCTGVEQDIEWLQREGHLVIFSDDDSYPQRLHQIAAAPPVLFLKGRHELLDTLQLAIVGSRNPTSAGLETARAFARHLSRVGLTICSGLAQGIDGAAHTGALEGPGSTVAVTGTGLDRIYPASHRKLAHRIAEDGLLVSEFPVGSGPQRWSFPRRNRVISGLSMGCLVVEAAKHSGSLITAQYSLEQGREVYAIPGSIHSPLARGCHKLIRQGAKLVETAMDIMEELPPVLVDLSGRNKDLSQHSETDEQVSGDLSEEEFMLMQALGHDPASVDALVERTGWSVDRVSGLLVDLEMRSCINALPGGIYMRTYPA